MRKEQITGLRIIVTPAMPWRGPFPIDDTHENRQTLLRRHANSVMDGIRRHVDDVEDIFAEFDTASVCSHCGWTWTEDGDTYNGGCCDEDEVGQNEKRPVDTKPDRA